VCLVAGDGFNDMRYRAYCYSDIEPVYRRLGFLDGEIPYLQARNEYPVGTGAVMWVASWFGRGEGDFLLANGVLLFGFGLITAWLLQRMVGDRALFFAAAPTLGLYAFLNWDLVPVALSTAGLYAFLRGRDTASGAWFGLGAAAKLYPGVLAIPAALDRLRTGSARRAWLLLAGMGIAWGVVNVPVAVVSWQRWSEVFRFSAERPPTPGTLWFAACRGLTGVPNCGATRAVNIASVASFVAIAVVAAWRRSKREPAFPRWTLGLPVLAAFLLTSKVYSPQYSLWLLPWFALVMPNLRLFLAFEAADLAVFFAEFSYLGAGRGGDLPAVLLAAAVLVRSVVLCALIVAFVRGRTTEPERLAGPSAQARWSTSPSSSS
jgi:uncharacterized membrane protein